MLSVDDYRRIGETKARYFRYLDTKQWDKLRGEFIPDARFEGFGSLFAALRGADDFIAKLQEHFSRDVISVHHGHMPEIVSLADGHVRAIWSMSDYVTWPRGSRVYRGIPLEGQWGIKGYGHYEDELVRNGTEWRISKLRLTRLRIDPLVGDAVLQPDYDVPRASAD